ncbi:alpha-amylase family glycosyl hydrolase [Anabaena subtropica]|uniref:Alpha-amylase n=1 Tax=Anabaena subtropica FACHB-260 TaxID=2692884 RepID=A0ABR8CQ69_9NOST|nr:alpha-amylase family glycosyl hydrolase [Anabaena subtropica]MBD2345340.1 alpha-amylase [Anabaena subtropica FACHB-260]
MAKVEEFAPQYLSDADLKPRGRIQLSPVSWRDQVLYQLLPDRFSDGNESQRELFDRTNPLRFQVKDKASWMRAGKKFVGGTLKGIRSKLDYLQGLGVTTLWINPPWKQRKDLETYHGYGIQNFLDIDPRFGTLQDLRDLIDAAHDRLMYVILDVIYNHSGNNWFYSDESGNPRNTLSYRSWPHYPVHGWRSQTGESIPEITNPEDGVWPQEFQNLDWYTRAGEIGNWDVPPEQDPLSPHAEFRRGDFYDLKDLNLENDQVIAALAKVYQYWIALSDCDGFRIDAVKHVSPEHSRKFCSAIRQYAQSIGKDNFLLAGEITSETMAEAYIDIIGRNLSSVLDIVSAPNALTSMAKGLAHPNVFFDLYNEHQLAGKYRQIGLHHVSVLDDHDMISRGWKQRFAAHNNIPNLYEQVAHVVGIQLTMPGIPCIYYGTEQAFDGNEGYHDDSVEPGHNGKDRYIREAMFGGAFGAFQTADCHFFNHEHPTYLRIAAIARIRNSHDRIGKALRRGNHYPRETSFCGYPFSIPGPGELVAWSQILFNTEVLMALNTHGLEDRGAEVTVDASIHPQGSTMSFLYKSDWSEKNLHYPPDEQTVVVQYQDDGRATVRIDLPPSGMAILV